jgi:glycosyltransferase involved in cell wall biosynthesis
MFNIPGHKTHVMRNAHLGVTKKEITKKEKLKICYTSTPWRGLDVLLLAWEILNPQDCELHVFSSCKIYGTDFAKEDTKYEFLYKWCERLPNVVYRGSIPNEELRNELAEFDILAYPSTFEETSCISVIEALSTGLRVVTSSIGALPETTEGWARMYSYNDDREEHGKLFAKILGEEIEKMFSGELVDQLTSQRDIYSKKWSWDERIKDWEYLFNQINVQVIENKNNYSTNSYNSIIS